jgi:hypothetical protein
MFMHIENYDKFYGFMISHRLHVTFENDMQSILC